jgi:hypothetical protein
MDDKQRLQLQNMIKSNNVEDQTDLIRNLKHSQVLRNEINNMVKIKSKFYGDDEKIRDACMSECAFLFTYYTDIYNKIKKDEIDITLLYKFLDILKRIEDGELDQNEGAFMVGTILKEIYIDSALKKSDKLDELYETNDSAPKQAEIKISWKEFKKLNVNI